MDYEKEGCLHEMFIRQAKKTPNALAIVDDSGISLTLGEVDRLTDQLAAYFQSKCGVCVNDVVGIFMEKSIEFVISYISALKAGAAYMPLDISYPDPLLKSILDEAKPKAICTKPAFTEKLRETSKNFSVFVMDDKWSEKLKNSDPKLEYHQPKVSLDDMAYLVYSSGTTGKPKGIRCPHRGAVFSYHWRHVHHPFIEGDRVACNVFFVWELLRPLLKGYPMYIIPDDVIYDPPLLCQFIQKHQITRMLFTPSLLEAVIDTQKDSYLQESLKSLRLIWLCGEVVTVEFLSRIISVVPWAKVLNLYSISECHDVSVSDLSAWFKEKKPTLQKLSSRFAPGGQLFEKVTVAIMDEHFNPLPIGVSGEVFVGGPALALGYLNRPELNAQKFLHTPEKLVKTFGPKLYRTGDWGYLLADGSLEICGRCDSMVKIRGYSVEIQAIEAALQDLACISNAIVLVEGAEGTDKYLVAYIVLQEQISRRDLRAVLKRKLPFYMIPSYFVFMKSLPLLPASSKCDKKALPPVDFEKDVVEPEALPQTPTEKKLALFWQETLNLHSVDIHESFFDYGGHSLTAARLLGRIVDEFHCDLTVKDLFANPTIFGLARLIDGVGDKETAPGAAASVDSLAEIEKHDLKNQVMDLYLRAFWRSLRWGHRWQEGCALLTGATGFLGCFLLNELLQNTKLRIICLVRETAEESCESRLYASLEKFGLWSETMRIRCEKRVGVYKGDVGLTQFGLSDADYHYLSYDVDFVIHAAAYVNLIYPYQALHGANVLGTQNVLLFCYANKIKPLHYVSTDAVFPEGLQDAAEDTFMDPLASRLKDGYSQSKFVAEQLVMKSRKRGLPAIIYRLGNQSGHSNSGAWNPQDFTYLMLYGICALKSAPNDIKWSLEMTPVDFTCSAIVQLATQHFTKQVGKTFHLVNTDFVDYDYLISWMKQYGYKLEMIPFSEWKSRLNRISESSGDPNVQYISRLVDTMIKDRSFFSNQSTYKRANTDEFLQENDQNYSKIDDRQLKIYFDQLIRKKNLPKPTEGKKRPLEGKVAIITGASSGIGAAIAKILACEGGAKIFLAARRLEKLEALKKSIEMNGGAEAIIVQCDVTDKAQVDAMVEKVFTTFGTLDILVNNAGITVEFPNMYYTEMKAIKLDQWMHQMDVNCKGILNCLAAVLPHFVQEKKGHIVNITSNAGKRAFPGLAVYSGTKFFIEGMSAAMRQELIEFNVKVTNIQPGDCVTELLQHTTDFEANEKFNTAGKYKNLDAEDVANAVIFALSQPNHCAINEILIEPKESPI